MNDFVEDSLELSGKKEKNRHVFSYCFTRSLYQVLKKLREDLLKKNKKLFNIFLIVACNSKFKKDVSNDT